MRQKKSSRLRGSVTQNNVSVRMSEQEGVGFLARLGILAAAIFIVVGGAGLLWHLGWPQEQMRRLRETGLSLTQAAQFAVKDITVQGRSQSNKDDVLLALNTQRGDAILDFDANAAATRLGKLPWVESAIVERRLPDTINVVLTERTPLARWQHDEKLYVIDTDGHILTTAKPEDFPTLPLVVGSGADREAQGFLELLKKYPEIQSKTDSIVRVGERRWDLHLHPNIVAKLPEQDVDSALHHLSVLVTEQKILERAIVAVDLRLPDRLVFEQATPAQQDAPRK